MEYISNRREQNYLKITHKRDTKQQVGTGKRRKWVARIRACTSTSHEDPMTNCRLLAGGGTRAWTAARRFSRQSRQRAPAPRPYGSAPATRYLWVGDWSRWWLRPRPELEPSRALPPPPPPRASLHFPLRERSPVLCCPSSSLLCRVCADWNRTTHVSVSRLATSTTTSYWIAKQRRKHHGRQVWLVLVLVFRVESAAATGRQQTQPVPQPTRSSPFTGYVVLAPLILYVRETTVSLSSTWSLSFRREMTNFTGNSSMERNEERARSEASWWGSCRVLRQPSKCRNLLLRRARGDPKAVDCGALVARHHLTDELTSFSRS